MIGYPKYVIVDNKKYKINTNFKVALKCNEIAQDTSVGDTERALAIIYLLFGDEGLDCNNYDKLLNYARKYLLCGKEYKESKEKPDMDFIEDYSYIKTSIRGDFGIDIDKEDMHWWEFNDLLNGLSNSELGNCCILNRIRNIRNCDLSQIKDSKERQRMKEAQEMVALEKYKPKKKQMTEEQRKSAMAFYKSLNN